MSFRRRAIKYPLLLLWIWFNSWQSLCPPATGSWCGGLFWSVKALSVVDHEKVMIIWSGSGSFVRSLLVNKIYLHTESRVESSYAHKVNTVAVTLTPRRPEASPVVELLIIMLLRISYFGGSCWSIGDVIGQSITPSSLLSRTLAWTWMEECPSLHQVTMTPFSTSGILRELHPSLPMEPRRSSPFLIRSEQPLETLLRIPRDRSRRQLKGWTWMPKEPRIRWICPSTLSHVVNIWLVQMVSTL